MLIDEPSILQPCQDPVLRMLSSLAAGGATEPTRLAQGVYLIGHFNGHCLLPYGQYDQGPLLDDQNCYGVCDGVDNLLDQTPSLQDPARQFVVTLTRVRRADQSPEGGWRWHKWGPYIGRHDPQCEYLANETGIDEVFCYHIYERKGA